MNLNKFFFILNLLFIYLPSKPAEINNLVTNVKVSLTDGSIIKGIIEIKLINNKLFAHIDKKNKTIEIYEPCRLNDENNNLVDGFLNIRFFQCRDIESAINYLTTFAIINFENEYRHSQLLNNLTSGLNKICLQ